MNKLLSLAAPITLALSFGAAQAQDKPATAQQNKMATCNKDAGDKKGDERKAFMKSCLSAKKETQQSKMKHLQQGSRRQEGRRAQEVHERVPEGQARRLTPLRARAGTGVDQACQ
jgi:hypothetical protein